MASLAEAIYNPQLQANGGYSMSVGGPAAINANERAYNATVAGNKKTLSDYINTMNPAVAQSQSLLGANTSNMEAVKQLTSLLGLGPGGMQQALSTLQSMPGYQFGLDSSTQALQRNLNKGGLAFSGNFADAANKNAVGYANQTYGNQLGYLSNYLNNQASLGQNYSGLLGNQADLQGVLNQSNTGALATMKRGNALSGS